MPYKDRAKKSEWEWKRKAADPAYLEMVKRSSRASAKRQRAKLLEADPELKSRYLHRKRMLDDPFYVAEWRESQKEKAKAAYVPKPRKAPSYPAPWTWLVIGNLATTFRAKKETGWYYTSRCIARGLAFRERIPQRKKAARTLPSEWNAVAAAIHSHFNRSGQGSLQKRWKAKCNRIVASSRLRATGSQIMSPAKPKEILALLEKQEFRCAYTGQPLTPEATGADHKTPVARGGHHGIDNMALVTRAVNSAKGTMTLDEFRRMCSMVVAHLGAVVIEADDTIIDESQNATERYAASAQAEGVT